MHLNGPASYRFVGTFQLKNMSAENHVTWQTHGFMYHQTRVLRWKHQMQREKAKTVLDDDYDKHWYFNRMMVLINIDVNTYYCSYFNP